MANAFPSINALYSMDPHGLNRTYEGTHGVRIEAIMAAYPKMIGSVARLISSYLSSDALAYFPHLKVNNSVVSFASLQISKIRWSYPSFEMNELASKHFASIRHLVPDINVLRITRSAATETTLVYQYDGEYTVWDIRNQESHVIEKTAGTDECIFFDFLNDDELLYVDSRYLAFRYIVSMKHTSVVIFPSLISKCFIQPDNEEELAKYQIPTRLDKVHTHEKHKLVYLGYKFKKDYVWELFDTNRLMNHYLRLGPFESPLVKYPSLNSIVSSSIATDDNYHVAILYHEDIPEKTATYVAMHQIYRKANWEYGAMVYEDRISLLSFFKLESYFSGCAFLSNQLILWNNKATQIIALNFASKI